MDRESYERYRSYAEGQLERAKIAITKEEALNIEVADFGLERFEEIGLMALTYVNTSRCCSKELILMPDQICPEHRHPMQDGKPGKEETFRCRQGEVYLFVEGTEERPDRERIPEDLREYFQVFHKIRLLPGQQYTLLPDSLHWFQAGKDGCIVSEFSTHSDDATDIFTDPNIKRIPEIEE